MEGTCGTQKGKWAAAWTEFKEVENNRAQCKHCGKSYAAGGSTHGTNNLNKHLKKCKIYLSKQVDAKQTKIGLSKNGDGTAIVTVPPVSFNKENCRNALIKMILLDELPFSFVEGEGFREFCAIVSPSFDIPSRRTVARDILRIYSEEKKKVKGLFGLNCPRVSLTTDCWTSVQNINYMVVTAHFVDTEWSLQKRILNFVQVSDHKGDTIGKILESCILEWGIDSVLTVTVDNASSNDKAMTYLKRALKSTNGLVLDGQYMHMRCAAHILHLIVSDGLKDLHSSIQSIRNAVKYVRSSPSRMQNFKSCAPKKRCDVKSFVQLDVATRWNSTYTMLETAVKFEKVFECFKDEDPGYHLYFMDEDVDGPPESEDWEKAKAFVQILEKFYKATLQFSASLTVTSNICFTEICSLVDEFIFMSMSNDVVIRQMATSMKAKFDKYWGAIEKINPLILIATVLDPRYKIGFLKFTLKDYMDQVMVEEVVKHVKEILLLLFEFYSASSSFKDANGATKDSGSSDMGSSNLSLSIDGGTTSVRTSKWKKYKGELVGTDYNNEVERFLIDHEDQKMLDDEDFEVLLWWKMNHTRYPILSAIARDVFAIPVSTVASESAFSTGGRILDPFRSSLTPKMVEASICTQNWLRSSKKYAFENEDTFFYEQLESEYQRIVEEQCTFIDD